MLINYYYAIIIFLLAFAIFFGAIIITNINYDETKKIQQTPPPFFCKNKK
jgi:hypothetical protein